MRSSPRWRKQKLKEPRKQPTRAWLKCFIVYLSPSNKNQQYLDGFYRKLEILLKLWIFQMILQELLPVPIIALIDVDWRIHFGLWFRTKKFFQTGPAAGFLFSHLAHLDYLTPASCICWGVPSSCGFSKLLYPFPHIPDANSKAVYQHAGLLGIFLQCLYKA